jgi:hypothetical protein
MGFRPFNDLRPIYLVSILISTMAVVVLDLFSLLRFPEAYLEGIEADLNPC